MAGLRNLPVTARREDTALPAIARQLAEGDPNQSVFAEDQDFLRSLRSTNASIGAGETLYDATSARLANNTVLEAELRAQAQQEQDFAAANSPRISSLADVKGVGDFVDMAQGFVGQGVASIGPILASGLGGRVAGGIAGGLIAGPPGALVGSNLGQIAGAGYQGFRMNSGEAASQQQADPDIAALPAEQLRAEQNRVGVTAGALDILPPLFIGSRLAKSFTGQFLKREASKTALRRTKAVAFEAAIEGATEGGQARLGQGSLDRLNPLRDRSHDTQETIDSIVGGIFGSGGISVATTVPGFALDKARGVAPDFVEGIRTRLPEGATPLSTTQVDGQVAVADNDLNGGPPPAGGGQAAVAETDIIAKDQALAEEVAALEAELAPLEDSQGNYQATPQTKAKLDRIIEIKNQQRFRARNNPQPQIKPADDPPPPAASGGQAVIADRDIKPSLMKALFEDAGIDAKDFVQEEQVTSTEEEKIGSQQVLEPITQKGVIPESRPVVNTPEAIDSTIRQLVKKGTITQEEADKQVLIKSVGDHIIETGGSVVELTEQRNKYLHYLDRLIADKKTAPAARARHKAALKQLQADKFNEEGRRIRLADKSEANLQDMLNNFRFVVREDTGIGATATPQELQVAGINSVSGLDKGQIEDTRGIRILEANGQASRTTVPGIRILGRKDNPGLNARDAFASGLAKLIEAGAVRIGLTSAPGVHIDTRTNQSDAITAKVMAALERSEKTGKTPPIQPARENDASIGSNNSNNDTQKEKTGGELAADEAKIAKIRAIDNKVEEKIDEIHENLKARIAEKKTIQADITDIRSRIAKAETGESKNKLLAELRRRQKDFSSIEGDIEGFKKARENIPNLRAAAASSIAALKRVADEQQSDSPLVVSTNTPPRDSGGTRKPKGKTIKTTTPKQKLEAKEQREAAQSKALAAAAERKQQTPKQIQEQITKEKRTIKALTAALAQNLRQRVEKAKAKDMSVMQYTTKLKEFLAKSTKNLANLETRLSTKITQAEANSTKSERSTPGGVVQPTTEQTTKQETEFEEHNRLADELNELQQKQEKGTLTPAEKIEFSKKDARFTQLEDKAELERDIKAGIQDTTEQTTTPSLEKLRGEKRTKHTINNSTVTAAAKFTMFGEAFIVHRDIGIESKWSVTHLGTGKSVGRQFPTLQAAFDYAVKIINKLGPEGIKKAVGKASPIVVKQKAPQGKVATTTEQKTATGNVVVKNGVAAAKAYARKTANAVYTLRTQAQAHFGNPFTSLPISRTQGTVKQVGSVAEAVTAYREWLTTTKYDGKFGPVLDARKAWILDQLPSLKGKELVYYKELGEPSHANVLDELVKASPIVASPKVKAPAETTSTTGQTTTPLYDKLPSPEKGKPTMTYAGVGARGTPASVIAQMTALAKELFGQGYTLNTGEARGADAAFRVGTGRKNVFTKEMATDKTRAIAKELHPMGQSLGVMQGLNFHARNTNQVFGAKLDSPVDFVLAWTPEGKKVGGTSQAIRLAEGKGIPVINMADKNWRAQLDAVLTKQEPTKKLTKVQPATVAELGKAMRKDKVKIVLNPKTNQYELQDNQGRALPLTPEQKKALESRTVENNNFKSVEEALKDPKIAARKKKIEDYLIEVLGVSNFTAILAKFLPEGGALASFDVVSKMIEVALDVKDPMSLAFHESFHGFVQKLQADKEGIRLYRRLIKLAQAPQMQRQMRKMLAGQEAALEQLSDPEEAVTYMYQFWAASKAENGGPKFNVTAPAENLFQRMAEVFKRILGFVGKQEQAEEIFRQFYKGDLANTLDPLADLKHKGITKFLEDNTKPVQKALTRVYRTPSDRLKALGFEHLSQIADGFFREIGTRGMLGSIQRSSQMEGQYKNQYAAITQELSAEEKAAVRLNLQKEIPYPEKSIEGKIQKLFRDMFGYASTGPNPILHPVLQADGLYDWEPLKQRKNYFTRRWNPELAMKNMEKLRALLQKESKGKLGVEELNAFEDAMRAAAGQNTPEQLENHVPRMVSTDARAFDFINHTNIESFAEFLEGDLDKTVMGYIRDVTHRREKTRTFGSEIEKIEELITRAKEQGLSKEDEADARTAIAAFEGSLGVGGLMSTPGAKLAIQSAITLVNVAILPLALFSSLPDPLGVLVRTGNLEQAGATFTRGVSQIYKDAVKKDPDTAQKIAEYLGIIESHQSIAAIGDAYNGQYVSQKLKKVNDTFFKLIGLDQFTKGTRIQAMAASMLWLRDEAIKAKAGDATAIKNLKDLELTADDISMVKDEKGVDTEFLNHTVGQLEGDPEASRRIQNALYRMVDEAILRPSSGTRPVWMSDIRMALPGHLKSFTFTFHNTIVKQVLRNLKEQRSSDETRAEAWLTIMPLLTFVPAMAAATLVRSIVSGKYDDDDDDRIGPALYEWSQRSAVAGNGTFLLDLKDDIRYSGLPINTFLGPVADSAFKLGRSAVDPDRDFTRQVTKLMPFSALYRNWLKEK